MVTIVFHLPSLGSRALTPLIPQPRIDRNTQQQSTDLPDLAAGYR